MKKKVADLLQDNAGDGWFQDTIVAHAPTMMGIFANLVVIFADYRAYDVVYQLTGSWWKALSASLACAIPFILWEISWQYNHTTDNWRKASLAMAGLAFATSIFLGVADFLGFQGPWADWLLGGVVIVTGVHTIVGFLYYYNDPDVARRRHKAQTLATMLDQEQNTAVAEQLLRSGSDLLAIISQMENQYDPEDVEMVMNILKGKKKGKPTERREGKQNKNSSPTPQAYSLPNSTASKTTQQPQGIPNAPQHSLDDFLRVSGLTREQAQTRFADRDAFMDFASEKFDYISGGNMKRIYGELMNGNFQKAGQR